MSVAIRILILLAAFELLSNNNLTLQEELKADYSLNVELPNAMHIELICKVMKQETNFIDTSILYMHFVTLRVSNFTFSNDYLCLDLWCLQISLPCVSIKMDAYRDLTVRLFAQSLATEMEKCI